MRRTAVDASALFALIYPDDEHNSRAATVLREAANEGELATTSVTVAEVAADPFFENLEEVQEFLEGLGVRVEGLSPHARFAAGRAFRTYLDRRGQDIQCPRCGAKRTVECQGCGRTVPVRQHVASDFLVGAHAEHQADRLVTFDAGFTRDYFDVECVGIGDP